MTIDIHNGIPNLNKQKIGDLERFAGEILFDLSHIRDTLFPGESPDDTNHPVMRLGDYANAKSLAKAAIINNQMVKAKIHEEQCKVIFASLPPWAKWDQSPQISNSLNISEGT